MSLPCSCYYDLNPVDIRWEWPSGYSTLQTKRTRKCVSCGDKIGIGDMVASFFYGIRSQNIKSKSTSTERTLSMVRPVQPITIANDVPI